MLNQSVLVLNRSYMPIHVTSARRAFALLYTGIAKAVNEQYELFDVDHAGIIFIQLSEDLGQLLPREVPPAQPYQ